MSFLSNKRRNTAEFMINQGLNFYFLECENRMWLVGPR